MNGNGGKKGGMNDGVHGMPNMMGMSGAGGNVGLMGNMPMAMGGQMGPRMGPQMGQMSNPAAMAQMGQMSNAAAMAQMGNIQAVQGLPAAAGMNGGGYFQGAGPEAMAGNPYYQQQMAAAMMNQQQANGNGNERFHPMMYARPPPAVNYMQPPPYQPYPPYPYPHPPQGDPITHYFSDENTSSCSIM